jgi:hypothetical protein
MSYETLANAIRSRFKTLVGDTQTDENTDALTVQYDNDPTSPPDDATWVKFTIRWGERRQADISASPRYRVVGIAYAQILSPIQKGDKFALQLAGVIEAGFRSVTAGGVTWRTPSVKRQGRQGDKYQINVECPFYADEVP